MIGETVSHYHVLEELGSGGMGVVYRAHDLSLDRDVALKFLPARLADDADALLRFQREAQLASSLNHPHICTIHDVDRHAGRPFIVMELCSGRTVKGLLQGGPLRLVDALDIATQTAQALDAAHRRGIIHRDIKPANISVGDGVSVKVLDFGLAKLAEPSQAPLADAQLDARRNRARGEELTRPGMAVGTVAYMSPEQARGLPLDARTDLFSLGAVLYEMVTGARAFQGPTPALVFDGILNREPVSPRRIAPVVPVELEAVLARMLRKQPAERHASAAELLEDLADVKRALTSGGGSAIARPFGSRRRAARPAPFGPLRRWRRLGVGALILAVVTAAGVALRAPRPTALSDRDPILIAGFENQTRDAVFDGTLSEALAVQLSQSPFLNIVPDERVREALRLMGRRPEEVATGALAREVCQRLGLRAMVGGSIARMGDLYVLLLEATECATGASLAREQGQAAHPEEVLQTLGEMTSRLRSRLGESLKSLQRYDAPIEQATTPSLEALKAYTLGIAQRSRGAEVESIRFFQRALELDRDFAAAAVALSTVYANLGEGSRSIEFARRAYASRERVSQRERFFITYQYYDRVTGDQLRAAETLAVWEATYRSDFQPANALAVLYNRLGQYERGVEEAREALARSPGHPFALSNLAHAYRGLGRYTEARITAERAVTLGVATVPTRRLLYQLAVLDGNPVEASRHLEALKGNPREFDLIAAQAQVAVHEGCLRHAGELYGRAMELAELRGLPEVGAAYLAHQALAHALYGDGPRALELARRALARSADRELPAGAVPRFRAVAVLGLLGDPGAERLARAVAIEHAESTFTQAVLVPITGAAIELRRGRTEAALEQLRPAAAYEEGTVAALIPIYLRGEAYRRGRQGQRALEQFNRLLDHRGVDPFSPVCALARLGVARAWLSIGNRDKSAQAYREFLAAWRQADEDLPILSEARGEYARLSRGAAAR